MIDAIKERFDVGVHHPGIACADVRLDLSHGLMRRASGAEPVTAGVEVGFHSALMICAMACWMNRSTTVGIPKGRFLPSGLGISTRFTGCGR